MKDLYFLFARFDFFLLVYAAVILDTLFGIIRAVSVTTEVFKLSFVQAFVLKMMTYTVYLIFANLTEHFAALTGNSLNGIGFIALVGILILTEGESIRKSISKLSKKHRLP